MKKKKTANLIMVLIIAAIAIAGVVTAFMLKTSTGDGLGSQYQIRELKDNAVITPGQEDHVCTITIVCDTILDNTNNLNEEKAPFVPRNGTILPKTRVSFAEGDTVFEVLNKVCKAADIQIEYSWTPMYNSYYIEGINHLYEFDVGPESGWMNGSPTTAAPPTSCRTVRISSGATPATVWGRMWVNSGWDERRSYSDTYITPLLRLQQLLHHRPPHEPSYL